ncbi:MAG: arginine N-succinyltransferase [Candidatus Omnitrophica bacterium]|nr:arginine N-succinyltransferase [Candidatus Omnitrophota bacterium]
MTAAPTFRIRQARVSDLPALWPLARQLDSYNLPADRRVLTRLVATSVRAFRGAVPKPTARYLFVMERPRDHRVVGCSLIIAKHGTPSRPHFWLDVTTAPGWGPALRLGMTTDGPTELGGLVLLPRFRGHRERLGRQLSYARVAYLAAHPERGEPEILVEYLPPLTRAGDSRFWRAFGGPLTGLSYREADRRSVTDTAFIRRAFPRTPVPLDRFPPAVRRDLGVVHPAAAGACRRLRAIGFRDLRQVEPFDGGPYYGARLADLTLVRRMRPGRLVAAAEQGLSPQGTVPVPRDGLLCTAPARGEFRAVAATYRWRHDQVEVSAMVMKMLEGQPGMPVHVTPL